MERTESDTSGRTNQDKPDDSPPDIVLQEWVFVPAKHKAVNTFTEAKRMSDEFDQPEKRTWLDDLPVDKEFSGVGFSYNQVYKDDGYKHEDHIFEDKCFRIKLSDDCFLYGVFDGHCGDRAAEFISQRIPAEILFGQLDGLDSDEDVKRVLQQAYHTVENLYFKEMDDLIAERTCIQQELMQLNSASLDSRYKAELARLRKVDQLLSSGTSALLALLRKNRLFIANVGNSRALLCRTDDKHLRVESLNDDHTLENESEVQRLANLGLPIENIRNCTKFGQQLYTRCMGDYSVKGGYKDNDQMSCAVSEPVIAVPDLEEAIDIDGSCNFLLLMSDGVYRSLIDATDTEHVNAEIAGYVATEFSRQSTLNGVSQAVIEKIARLHHDAYALSEPSDPKHARCAIRDDMTLLIRNFNYKLRSLDKSGLATSVSSLSAHSPSSSESSTNSLSMSQVMKKPATDQNLFFPHLPQLTNQSLMDTYKDSNQDSIVSSAGVSLELDSDGRLEAYVSFDVLNNAMSAMTADERQDFLKRITPRMDCETIVEQPESPQ